MLKCRGVEFVLEVHGEPMHIATNYDKPIETDRWYHVAGSVTIEDGITAYLNGVKSASVDLSHHDSSDLDSWLFQSDAEVEVMRISPPLSADDESGLLSPLMTSNSVK